ncbi:hypothetical protein MARCHEWKA_00880 [Brevundimonas phage vB_BpoS-Marchewka]|uniref:Uncharacterized protein n=1 Tax=Brevundimonas phage vB_BpoS-Marchewka TaxID=2948604 RepID=A0A9E7N2C6_9CAUD|nr:hypothetical protein MARCHEWKA_00880 [Brevundimonas phage vB_BpoS-Marchewka]
MDFNTIFLPVKAALEAGAKQALTIVKETKIAAAMIFILGVMSGCVLYG